MQPALTVTPPQRPPLYNGQFFGGQSIHRLWFKPSSGGSREGVRGARGPGSPLIFRPKWGPKGRKNVLLFTSQSIEKSEGKSQLHAYYGKGGEGGGINTATTQPLAFLFPNHVQFLCSPFYALRVQRKIQENRTISEPRGSSDTFVLCISHPTCLTDKLICIL